MQMKRNDTYQDIIGLPHHVSTRRKQMSLHDRAAQFAPFAALTGHEAAIKETERQTEVKIELDEHEIEILDRKLQYIEGQEEPPVIEITYFLPDQRKDGGAYVEMKGKIRRIDHNQRRLRMEDGTEIPIGDVLRINLEISP